MNQCHLCGNAPVKVLLDCGPLPLCNRYPADATDEEFAYPFVLGQCQACGVLQLINQVSAAELAPRVNWITYSEPEGHLDEMTALIAGLPGLTPESVIAGVSFKDDSTLERLRRQGFPKVWRLDTKTDLGIAHPGAGAETIQDRLVPTLAAAVAKKRGRADVLIIRHVLEHAHRPRVFLEALRSLLNPKGYLIFEVPDCERAVGSLDYSTLWEEHTLYFTPETFRRAFAATGYSLFRFEMYAYAFENSLVAIVKSESSPQAAGLQPEQLHNEVERAEHFAAALPGRQAAVQHYLSDFRKNQGKIAILGAGHLACFFINLLQIKDDVEFVVDDNPNKQGLLMPGSRLPIVSSARLTEGGVKLCLLCVNPEVEEKVAQRNRAFVESGGRFLSIFPASKRALKT